MKPITAVTDAVIGDNNWKEEVTILTVRFLVLAVVWRGGSFAFNVSYCERAYRGYIGPDNSGVNLGLRLVCSP